MAKLYKWEWTRDYQGLAWGRGGSEREVGVVINAQHGVPEGEGAIM